MSITLQAQMDDGTWIVRNGFVTENAMVRIGSMRAAQLEDKARRTMDRWHDYQDGRTLRVHSTKGSEQ